MTQKHHSLEHLTRIAREYPAGADLPIAFGPERYTRKTIFRDEKLEVVVICFAEGQTTSVHDHQGSNCVIRVLHGKILENHFVPAGRDQLELLGSHYLQPGDVSGLDGQQIHQLCNLDARGTVLLNFYSPPFRM